MLSDPAKHLIALAVSITGCVGSTYWYQAAKESFASGPQQGKTLAVLRSANNQVEKKPGQRLIWLPLKTGNVLTNGDTIRTGGQGEGRVELLESKTLIELEPDSLIVIEKTKDSISLGLLSGGLFITSKGKTDSKKKAPVIRAGSTTLSLGSSDSELNLSLSEGKEATVAVAKGNISVDTDGQKTELQNGDTSILTKEGAKKITIIKTTYPQQNAIIDIGEKGNKKIEFRWVPLEKGLQVHLEIGESRSKLTRHTKALALGARGSLTTTLPAGKMFWRLVATGKNKKNISSVINRATTLSLSSALAISPEAGGLFFLAKNKKYIAPFSWAVPTHADSTTLLVSRKKTFKKIIYKKIFTSKSEVSIPLKKSGKYYWKLQSHYRGIDYAIESKVMNFTIKKQIKITPPELILPRNNKSIPISNAKKGGLFAEWSPVPGITSYQFQLSQKVKGTKKLKVVILETTEFPQFRINKFKPGKYSWKVKAISPDNHKSKWSDPFTFKIKKTRKMPWIKPTVNTVILTRKKAIIDLEWRRGSKFAVAWKVRFSEKVGNLSEQKWKVVKTTKTKINLAGIGKYRIEVQALNKNKDVIAATDIKEIEVRNPPLLTAPIFENFAKTANPDGSIRFNWKSIDTAKSYRAQVRELETNNEFIHKKKKPSLRLRNLKPGAYAISLASVNIQGEIGEYGEEKTFEVPKISNIAAPTVEMIKIE